MERVKSVLKGNKRATFKPKRKFDKGSKRYDLHKKAKNTLGSGDLKLAVKLPDDETLEEWVAVHIIDFFNQINLLYASISEYCREETCPIMSAGTKYEYLWADGEKIKRPIQCSAPEYVDYLLSWIQGLLDNENVFPSNTEVPFPKSFISTAKQIFRKLFRVFAHIYYSHFESIVQLQEEAHLNTSFKHFYFFIMEFDFVDKKETAPLADLIGNMGLD